MALRFWVSIGAALLLAGCGTQLEKTQGLEPTGPEFTQSLYTGYVDLSQSEYNEADYRASDAFARRAQLAAAGQIVMPEEISARRLPADEGPALTEARQRLMAALDGGARERYPQFAATAQTRFDCWMQEQEENRQPVHIAACRDEFNLTIAILEAALAPPVAAVTAEPGPAPEPRTFVVYFDFDDASLTDGVISKLAEAQAYAGELAAASITVEGHTDLAGPTEYNDRLAMIRAELVANALRERALDPGSVNGFGQSKPAVATDDGMAEPLNRRVEITVAPK